MTKMKFKAVTSGIADDAETLSAKHELWRMGDLSWKLKGIQHQLHASNTSQDSELTVNLVARRCGKCLVEGTLIPTTTGLKKIEDITTDDYVYGYNLEGKVEPTKVIQLHNQGIQEVVDLVSSNKVYATTTLNHRFLTIDSHSRKESVKRIHEFTSRTKIRREFIDFEVGYKEEPHAYAIGALLGDGCSREAGNLLRISSNDESVVKKITEIIGAKNYYKSSKNNFTWSISNISKNEKELGLFNGDSRKEISPVTLNHYDSWCKGKYAHEKYIDLNEVKTWNRNSCLSLLAGLIDTDGSVHFNDNCLTISFCSQSFSMVEAVKYLMLQLFSVDCNIYIDKRSKYKNGPLYIINIKNNLHAARIVKGLDSYSQLERKKWKNEYNSLTVNNSNEKFIGIKVQNPRKAQCYDIGINNGTHLYLLANGMITHNTYTNIITALEVLIQHDFSIIKYACPTQKMVKDTIVPLLRLIMSDAPPEFQFDNCWSSENRLTIGNSFLSVAGTDNKNVENLRGAYAHVIFADEAGFWDDLSYAVDSVLLPQLDTVGGKLIMTSTPNYFNPRHEFHTRYVFPQEALGKLQKFTVYDSSFVTREEIENIIIPRYAHSGGINSPQFRCEYLVEIPRSSETTIIPNFYSNRKDIIVDEMKLPPFVDTYVSGDIGVRDLTVYLFGFYDFKTATLNIMDEWVMNGMEMTTKVIAEAIRLKEETHFTDSEGFVREPLRRVMDNNLNLIIDLNKLHGLNFIATKKDNKAAAINNLNILVDEGRLKIHSRCKNLIYHMDNAQWKQGAGMGKEFDHLSASIDGSLLESHADGVDALNYMLRNISLHHNPYPSHINNITENQQQRITTKEEDTSTSFIKKLLGRKR